MLTRDIIKLRRHEDSLISQVYNYSVQESYLQYRRSPVHRFLRHTFLNGVPGVFLNPDVTTASGSKDYVPVYENGERVFNERKPSEGKLIAVEKVPNCLHLFSQVCLASNGFVDKNFSHEYGPTLVSAYYQHDAVQRYFMNTGVAEAMEIPVWNEEKTGFIDLLVKYKGGLWIIDYKPQASQAKNKWAASQLLEYRNLFANLTGLNTKDIRLAWFDERDTFIINA